MAASKASWRVATAAIGTALALTFATPGFAGADSDLARLQQMFPDVSAQEIMDSANAYAAANGITAAEALAAARAEAEDSLAESDDGDCRRKVVNNAKYGGDVFHSTSSTYGFEHGHTGIYSAVNRITEARGKGNKSESNDVVGRSYCATVTKMYVDTSDTNRGKAGHYAHDSLRGKDYDVWPAFNKDDDISKLNCSELVWKAYKFSVDVDLDGNGGPGVYPDNIKDSDKTVTYETLS